MYLEEPIMQFKQIFTYAILAGSLATAPAQGVSFPDSFDSKLAWNIALPTVAAGILTWSTCKIYSACCKAYKNYLLKTRCYNYKFTQRQQKWHNKWWKHYREHGYISRTEQFHLDLEKLRDKIIKVGEKAKTATLGNELNSTYFLNTLLHVDGKYKKSKNSITITLRLSGSNALKRTFVCTTKQESNEDDSKEYIWNIHEILEFTKEYFLALGYPYSDYLKSLDYTFLSFFNPDNHADIGIEEAS